MCPAATEAPAAGANQPRRETEHSRTDAWRGTSIALGQTPSSCLCCKPYLWGHIVLSSHPRTGLVLCRINGQAKVPKHQLAICLKEYVFRLDVSVDDAT
jgi:hypothetical protein